MKLLQFFEGIYDDVEPPKPVKLRGFGNKDDFTGQKEFVDEFKANTKPAPMSSRARLYGDVVIDIDISRGGIRLVDIKAAGGRGAGQGTKALQFLTSLADKHKVKITADSEAYLDDTEQANERLFSWYVKHGFSGEPSGQSQHGGYDIEYTPKPSVHESGVAYGARFARLSELREAAGGQFVYHATMAKNLGNIMGKGLTLFNDSLWVAAGSPDERYQSEPSVFAFEDPLAAFRWAHKIRWDYKEPAIVIKLKRGNTWEQDPSGQFMTSEGALMSKESIPPNAIAGAKTLDQIGTPNSTGLHGDEFDQHVHDTMVNM